MGGDRKIAGLVVAAGYSSRMGAFKPLLPLGGKTVLEMAVDSLLQGGVGDIRVILGHRADELVPVVMRTNAGIIHNPLYDQGMFSSVVAGLTGLAGAAEAFFLLPGDTPLIRPNSIKAMIKEYRKTGAAVIQPVFGGQKGHPPLIGAKCFSSILQQETTSGLRGILEQFETESREIEVADQGILLDIDTPSDYEALTQFYARRNIPTYEECMVILRIYQVCPNVVRHGQAVAAVGGRIAGVLNKVGLNLSVDLVVAGGLVHDLAKGKPNHARRGEELLACLGFPAVAKIIASHMDMEIAADHAIDEAAVVFLADKLIQGDRPVSFIERFSPALARFADSPDIIAGVLRRMRTAEAIRDRVVSLVGISRFNQTLSQ